MGSRKTPNALRKALPGWKDRQMVTLSESELLFDSHKSRGMDKNCNSQNMFCNTIMSRSSIKYLHKL